jgi:hypothetical protein
MIEQFFNSQMGGSCYQFIDGFFSDCETATTTERKLDLEISTEAKLIPLLL